MPGLAIIGLASCTWLGWAVAVWALFRTLIKSPPQDKMHPAIVTLAALLGGLGDAVFLAWAGADWADGLAVAEMLGIWGFLTPTFLAVCHRMIPWFTGRIVPNYVMIRPYGPLWVVSWPGCLIHGVLEMCSGMPIWPGPPIWPWRPSCSASRPSGAWRAVPGRSRLLAMLHVGFLWAGRGVRPVRPCRPGRVWRGLSWSAGQAPVHALGIGFFATMLIGMASRVSLGHSGRKLEADAADLGAWSGSSQGIAITRMLPDLAPVLAWRP
jgi:uncharacterized protein involved in response to NO